MRMHMVILFSLVFSFMGCAHRNSQNNPTSRNKTQTKTSLPDAPSSLAEKTKEIFLDYAKSSCQETSLDATTNTLCQTAQDVKDSSPQDLSDKLRSPSVAEGIAQMKESIQNPTLELKQNLTKAGLGIGATIAAIGAIWGLRQIFSEEEKYKEITVEGQKIHWQKGVYGGAYFYIGTETEKTFVEIQNGKAKAIRSLPDLGRIMVPGTGPSKVLPAAGPWASSKSMGLTLALHADGTILKNTNGEPLFIDTTHSTRRSPFKLVNGNGDNPSGPNGDRLWLSEAGIPLLSEEANIEPNKIFKAQALDKSLKTLTINGKNVTYQADQWRSMESFHILDADNKLYQLIEQTDGSFLRQNGNLIVGIRADRMMLNLVSLDSNLKPKQLGDGKMEYDAASKQIPESLQKPEKNLVGDGVYKNSKDQYIRQTSMAERLRGPASILAIGIATAVVSGAVYSNLNLADEVSSNKQLIQTLGTLMESIHSIRE
ncbi:MAG: hypothetical protein KA436_09135 [Oligoflexales bacterium]|nr:hypothetical protein [Oligoflexales bacterium]